MIIGVSNRAPSCQRTVLRLHESRWETVTEERAIYIRLRVRPVIAIKKCEGIIAGLSPALHAVEHLRRCPGGIKTRRNGIRTAIALNGRIGVHNPYQVRREKVVEEWNRLNLAGIHILLALLF